MSQIYTLEVPDQLANRAREVAERTHRRLEDVLLEWLDRAASEPPIESLSDDEILALCDTQMDETQQGELSDLLANQREDLLDADGRFRLDTLMQVYRRGMVRKAQALKIAVERGLRPPLG